MSENNEGKAIVAGVLFVIATILFFMFNPTELVSSGYRGVQTQFGEVKDEILPEGFNFVNPMNKITEMPVNMQKLEVEATASSKDLQAIAAKIAVNYHIDATKVNKVYQDMRGDYEQKVIYPAVLECMKKATAYFTAEELVTKREAVKDSYFKSLKEVLAVNYIIVDNVFFTDFDYSEQFNTAIEAKVKAEQDALTEKNNLATVRYQNEQKLSTAKTDAEAIRIKAQAVTQQGGKDYVQLMAIEKWNGQLPTQMVPGSTVPFINLTR